LSYVARASPRTRLLAFLAAGFSAALVGALIVTGWIFFESKGQIANPFGFFYLSLIVASVACFAAGVFLALPLSFLLSSLRLESLGAYLFAGLTTGTIAAMPVLLAGFVLPLNLEELLTAVIAGGIPGSVSGWAWWRVYRRDRVRATEV